jgi:hypothetical protein
MLTVSLSDTALKIISALAQLTNERKGNKKIYVNSFSISKLTGLDWHTVDANLKNNLFIKEIKQ